MLGWKLNLISKRGHNSESVIPYPLDIIDGLRYGNWSKCDCSIEINLLNKFERGFQKHLKEFIVHSHAIDMKWNIIFKKCLISFIRTW